MVLMLPGFNFLCGLGYLTSDPRRVEKDAETQYIKRRQATGGDSIAGHVSASDAGDF
jgi:hypothetical protein